MSVEINALESARFGVIAAHVRDLGASHAEIDAAAAASGVQMLTLKIECGDHPLIHAAEANDFRLMDTIVYYERTLCGSLPELPVADDGSIRDALPADAEGVGDIARAAFANYLGHFHADPRLDGAAADAVYIDWAQNSVTPRSEGDRARVLQSQDRLAGFLTTKRNSASEIEIVLNAVHPDLQRRGYYERLLHDSLVTGREAGADRVVVSTQLNNFRVQRVWSKLGFRLASARHTFHKWYF